VTSKKEDRKARVGKITLKVGQRSDFKKNLENTEEGKKEKGKGKDRKWEIDRRKNSWLKAASLPCVSSST